MRKAVAGDYVVQVRNPDPFAAPAWRSPVYRTPPWIIAAVVLLRLLWRLLMFLARHPLATLTATALGALYAWAGWPGPVTTVGASVALVVTWRLVWPASFTRHVAHPARRRLRAWHYRRRWHGVMTIGGLAEPYRNRVLLPVLGKVTTTGCVDRVTVGLVSGQSPADFARQADNLAHGFGALLCRIRSARPGMLILEFVCRDALAAIILALPVPARPDLRALPVGVREDGQPWKIRLKGTHLIIAGATGAGKASLLWGLIRAMLPLITAGLVRPLAADVKGMELAYGKVIFERHGGYAADPYEIADMLEAEVAAMRARAMRFAGVRRDHTATMAEPFVVIFVDEVAFLSCYHPDKTLRDRIKAALATLTTQGRAVGWCVIAALQDPRKEVLPIRNLFPDRIAMRLDEPEQVDLVLGDGARDRGALAHLIPVDEATGAGIAYVRLADDPDPRAGTCRVGLRPGHRRDVRPCHPY